MRRICKSGGTVDGMAGVELEGDETGGEFEGLRFVLLAECSLCFVCLRNCMRLFVMG